MQPNHSGRALADDDGPGAYDIPRPGTEQHRAVRHALAQALELARLQVGLLERLEEADQAGDEDAVLRGHAELDHVMARMAEAEQVRTGALAALAEGSDLTCAGCGTAAEPVYQAPRLLGYRCASCGWEGDDPAAQDRQKRADALDAAAAAVRQAIGRIADALVSLNGRGKQARAKGISALGELEEDLAAVDRRLQKTRRTQELRT
jgi:hypothetical protein